MSLTTPEAIRTLQRKLYGKAKTEPGYRFYLLYDKVWRADILRPAYDLARANKGAPGVDGATFEQIEATGLEGWLTRLGEQLRAKTYQCQPVRRGMIPKPGSGERPLGIPTIRDRVVQTAAKLVLEPIFEADLEPAAYGYRPGHSAAGAIQQGLGMFRQGLSLFGPARPEDRRSPARHVLAAVVAGARGDRERTGVPHAEPLADDAAQEHLPA